MRTYSFCRYYQKHKQATQLTLLTVERSTCENLVEDVVSHTQLLNLALEVGVWVRADVVLQVVQVKLQSAHLVIKKYLVLPQKMLDVAVGAAGDHLEDLALDSLVVGFGAAALHKNAELNGRLPCCGHLPGGGGGVDVTRKLSCSHVHTIGKVLPRSASGYASKRRRCHHQVDRK